jgi:hypothetical protein
MRVAVPVTPVTAEADDIADQIEPDQAYIVEVVEFQYVAPVISAPPWLSTVGADALEPK